MYLYLFWCFNLIHSFFFLSIILTDPSFPTLQKIHHPSKHNSLYLKHLKYHNLQISYYITMKKKMIQGFPILFTHSTPFYHYDMMFVDIIQSENSLKWSCPSEKSQPQRSLSPPNALSREIGVNIKKNLVKGFDLKRSVFFRASNIIFHHLPDPP